MLLFFSTLKKFQSISVFTYTSDHIAYSFIQFRYCVQYARNALKEHFLVNFWGRHIQKTKLKKNFGQSWNKIFTFRNTDYHRSGTINIQEKKFLEIFIFFYFENQGEKIAPLCWWQHFVDDRMNCNSWCLQFLCWWQNSHIAAIPVTNINLTMQPATLILWIKITGSFNREKQSFWFSFWPNAYFISTASLTGSRKIFYFRRSPLALY